MKKWILLLSLGTLVSACGSALLAPKPKPQITKEIVSILGDPWQIDFQLIHNAMPGANGDIYGVLSMYREDQGQTFAWIKAERLWLYSGDSLIYTSSEFENGFQILNQQNISFPIRNLEAFAYSNIHAIVRMRNSWGSSYTLHFPDLGVNSVY